MYENQFNEYRMTFDYHTHTVFSHGKGSIEDNVKVAVGQGLEAIAISDHGPGHLFFGVKREDFPIMRGEVERLRPLYPNIGIFLSVEANIIYKGAGLDINSEEAKLFDFVIGGYHFGIPGGYCARNWLQAYLWRGRSNKKLKTKNTEMIVKSIYENKMRILTHPGDKAEVYMEEIAQACAHTNTWMEINSWHEHMTVEEIKEAASKPVTFVISSDAHHPSRIGDFKPALKRAIEAGLDLERIVNIKRKE